LDLYWTCVGVPSEAPTSPDQEVASTTFRLTAGKYASCSLILKAFLAVQGVITAVPEGFCSTICTTSLLHFAD
jgi:hypothetical protein